MQTSSSLQIFEDIGELLTLQGAVKKDARRAVEDDLSIIPDAVMVCQNGRVAWVGSSGDFRAADWPGERVSLKGATVLPAFVEGHTHAIFAGDRAEEFEWRMQGKTYQEIAARGGGILSTVRATRQATFEQLKDLAQARVDCFVRQGVATLEIKSGYGLDLDTEKKILRVARSLRGPEIVTTYLGAHSRSPDFPALEDYLKYMTERVLPEIAREKLADRVDIYIEKGFFDLKMSPVYLQKAQDLKLAITAHVEQLSEFGGAELALNFSPQSLDHLVYLSSATIDRLAKSSTTAVLLPASDLYLKMKYPPARTLIDQGARVAISTDFNPGTSPTQDLSLVGVLARLEMGMSLPEVLVAYTLGAAHALGKAHEIGSLIQGKYCDFAVLEGSWKELFYSIGHHPIRQVYRHGQILLRS